MSSHRVKKEGMRETPARVKKERRKRRREADIGLRQCGTGRGREGRGWGRVELVSQENTQTEKHS